MAQTRLEIRERARDYLAEEVADIWSDDQLNRYFLEELRSLPRKGIYLEQLWTTTTIANQQDYTLPTGTYKVESTERNDGSSTYPDYNPISGVDNYAGAIYLPYMPSDGEQIRIKIKKKFTEIADDVTALDVPDDKTEVLVWGIVVRAYKQLVSYYRSNKAWDSVTKPGGVDMYAIQQYLRDAIQEYKDLVKEYATSPRPRDIDLAS